MGDPLIDRYKASFLTKHPARTAHEPLDDSKLKKLSEQIQSTGKHPGTPTPSVPSVRFTKLQDPQDWIAPPRAPGSMQQQFELLKRQELERLAKAATQPENLQVPQNSALPPVAPISMQQQFDQLKRQEREKWAKITDELWRAEAVEYDILFELYKTMVVAEYIEIKNSSAKAPFKEFEERGGVRLYSDLRPVYYRSKIKEPHKLIMRMVEPGRVKLARVVVNQGIHPSFATILERVEKNINKSMMANPDTRPVQYVGCFRPDAIGDRISNHMIGAAIDIDSSNNPHLKGDQIAVLDLVLAFRAEDERMRNPLVTPEILKVAGSWLAEIPKLDDVDGLEIARRFYNKTVKISEKTKAFLNDYMAGWAKKQTPADQRRQEAFKLLDQMSKKFGGAKGLEKVQTQGFISIPAEVFEALVTDPDLQWGNYTFVHPREPKRRPGLDVMHFEVKPAVQRALIAAEGTP